MPELLYPRPAQDIAVLLRADRQPDSERGYCKRSVTQINKLKETNKYQYNNASKIQKLLTQGQSEFVKFVCCLLS